MGGQTLNYPNDLGPKTFDIYAEAKTTSLRSCLFSDWSESIQGTCPTFQAVDPPINNNVKYFDNVLASLYQEAERY